ncbi:hypothetical protein [Streptomyces sp. CB02923]|uniref:hypothetical protein n=1 Tax=Streptomyces sp. CB02923 TaxID=1718985 RepID=UPI001900C430|nr:hypothetical protein [Streptomyces sp. CB02923]
MRPAEINAALGREDTAGQRASLRNTLERAVQGRAAEAPGRRQLHGLSSLGGLCGRRPRREPRRTAVRHRRALGLL